MVIKSFEQLVEWVNNQQKTQNMLHLFDKTDNPPKRDNNAIKTFKQPQNRNLPQQQNRNQVKSNRGNINGPFTYNRNNPTQFGAISYHAWGGHPKAIFKTNGQEQ